MSVYVNLQNMIQSPFYRDSHQNEIDILLKQEGEITAIEVKSSMTYHPSFEKHLSKLSEWIKTPVTKKIIVYAGLFENTVGDINVINYKHLQNHLPIITPQPSDIRHLPSYF